MDEWIINGTLGTIWKFIKVQKIKSTSIEDDYGHSAIEIISEKIIKGVLFRGTEPYKWIAKGMFSGKTNNLITQENLNINDFIIDGDTVLRVSSKKSGKWDMNRGHYEYELEKVDKVG